MDNFCKRYTQKTGKDCQNRGINNRYCYFNDKTCQGRHLITDEEEKISEYLDLKCGSGTYTVPYWTSRYIYDNISVGDDDLKPLKIIRTLNYPILYIPDIKDRSDNLNEIYGFYIDRTRLIHRMSTNILCGLVEGDDGNILWRGKYYGKANIISNINEYPVFCTQFSNTFIIITNFGNLISDKLGIENVVKPHCDEGYEIYIRNVCDSRYSPSLESFVIQDTYQDNRYSQHYPTYIRNDYYIIPKEVAESPIRTPKLFVDILDCIFKFNYYSTKEYTKDNREKARIYDTKFKELCQNYSTKFNLEKENKKLSRNYIYLEKLHSDFVKKSEDKITKLTIKKQNASKMICKLVKENRELKKYIDGVKSYYYGL